jgi:hypothetical protein
MKHGVVLEYLLTYICALIGCFRLTGFYAVQ